MSELFGISNQVGSAPGLPVNGEKQVGVIRVLVLEDVAVDAELMERELRKNQLSIVSRCVQTRDKFLSALDEFRPDIILSDYAMPQFTALEALRLLHATPYDTPFILVTGSQSEEVAVQCMKEGADDYILKTSLKRLPTAVLNAIQKKEAERERQRAMFAVKQSEEHFRSLIENALDIIAVLNLDGTFRYASPSVRVLGYRPEELIGKSLLSFVVLDDVQEVRRIFHDVLESPGQVRTFEFCARHKDGSGRVVEAISRSINPNAEGFGVVLNARDITERKQQENEIEKLASFPRLNPNPIFEIAADGRLTYYNRAAEQMAKSLDKLHPSELLPPDIHRIIHDALQTGKSESGLETAVNERVLTWMFFPVITNQVVHCYARDITDRLSLENQLRQSQKMESIGQLAAGVAHDFNNILTLVQGYSGLLLSDKTLPAETLESLQQISAASERASNLTQQLLLFSRKQKIQPQEIDLNETISSITKLLRRVLGENVALHFDYQPGLPPIHADTGMMEQILMNLAINARDAMTRGGELTVATTFVEVSERQAKVNPEARPGTFVCLRVSDTGAGIPASVLPRIFEPFFTTKEIGKGTGLGLATVYGIVKQHSGWIEVASRVNEGTTFKIYFPVSARPVQEKKDGDGVPTDVRGGNETILIVEDEPELRSLVKEILSIHGYRVLEAASGPEALPVWERHHDEIDLLLTDMVMPGNMTGRELAQNLLARKPSLRVIYTSGYSMEVLGNDSRMKRGVNFLPKPYHPLTLIKIVRDCLDTRVPAH